MAKALASSKAGPGHAVDNGNENGDYCIIIGYILGLYWDNGKENGNYRDSREYIRIIGYILGLYRDNGKENGN